MLRLNSSSPADRCREKKLLGGIWASMIDYYLARILACFESFGYRCCSNYGEANLVSYLWMALSLLKALKLWSSVRQSWAYTKAQEPGSILKLASPLSEQFNLWIWAWSYWHQRNHPRCSCHHRLVAQGCPPPRSRPAPSLCFPGSEAEQPLLDS